MSRERLPLIGSPGNKTTAKAAVSSPSPMRPHQAHRRKHSQQQQTQASPHPHPGPSVLLSDSAVTPWGVLALSESSFTSIPAPPAATRGPPPAPPPSPPDPPAPPRPTPSSPRRHRRLKEEEGQSSSSSFDSAGPSPPATAPQDNVGADGRGLRARRRVLPQRRVPRPPRLPPLRPVTTLSFSRSFTFSFFELPLHQTPRCRAQRIRNLMQLLRQIHY